MVLEALAAVALAGNIVQFVGFVCQVFETAASIDRSQLGTSQKVYDVESVTEALQEWCRRFATPQISQSQQRILQQHPSLLQLAHDCQTTANNLLLVTKKLKARSPHSKWSSFRAAIITKWNEKDIKDMEKRLEKYRQQIALEIAMLHR